MTNKFIKPEVVVNAAIGLLEREVVLPRLVWRQAAADFTGAKDDTVSLRLPAYLKANKRELRSGATRDKSSLHQRKVDVTLDTDLYLDVPVTDEEMTLDIKNFGAEVLSPMIGGIARGAEDHIYDTMAGADYADQNEFEIDLEDMKGSIAEARELLNKGNVPMEGRTLAIGSEVDSAMIQLDNLVRADQSGSTDALREALIGRVYGFNVVMSPLLAPGEAFAFHRTAFPMASRAPIVSAGAPWGASASANGFAVRTVRVFDPDQVEDRAIADSWIGSGVTTDAGTFDSSGRFEPAEDPTEEGVENVLVRAVHLTAAGGGNGAG